LEALERENGVDIAILHEDDGVDIHHRLANGHRVEHKLKVLLQLLDVLHEHLIGVLHGLRILGNGHGERSQHRSQTNLPVKQV